MGYLDNDGLTRLWAKIKNYIDAHSSGGVTLDKVYPVVSIYMSVNNTNPGTLFGGTWVTWGAGRVPVSVNTSDGDFSTVEKTGGEKTHTLSINEMPSHKHSTTVKVTEKSLTGTVHNFAGQSASWGPGNTVSGICSASGDDTAFYPSNTDKTTKYNDTNATTITAGKCKFVAKNSGILFVQCKFRKALSDGTTKKLQYPV